jgi:polyphosphate kinase
MDRRVEIVWPVEAEQLKAKIIEILAFNLGDNIKSHSMRSDGTYIQTQSGKQKICRSQERLIELVKTEKSQPLRLRDALRHLEAVTNGSEFHNTMQIRASK